MDRKRNILITFIKLRQQLNRSISEMDKENIIKYEAKLDQLFETDKKNPIFLIEKAKIYEAKNNYEKALLFYNQSLLIYPNNSFVLFKEACCLRNLGKKTEAIEKYKECIALESKRFGVKSLSGKRLQQRVINHLYIEQDYLIYLQLCQNKYIMEAFYELEDLFFKCKQYNHALIFYKNINKSSVFYRDAINNIAKCLFILRKNSEDLKESDIDNLVFILHNNPDFWESWEILGQIYELNNDNENALGCYRMALNVNSNVKTTILNMAYLLQTKNDNTGIISLLQDKLSIYGDNYKEYLSLFNLLVNSYFEIGDYFQAFSTIEESKNIIHKSSDYWCLRGICLWSLDKRHESIKAFKQALKIDPRNYYASNNLADSYMCLEQYKKAIYFYKLALMSGSEEAQIYGQIAIALSEIGKCEEALVIFEELEQSGNTIPHQEYYKARILGNSGKIEEAINILKKYIKEYPHESGQYNYKTAAIEYLNDLYVKIRE